jgi:hypothetical protein
MNTVGHHAEQEANARPLFLLERGCGRNLSRISDR